MEVTSKNPQSKATAAKPFLWDVPINSATAESQARPPESSGLCLTWIISDCWVCRFHPLFYFNECHKPASSVLYLGTCSSGGLSSHCQTIHLNYPIHFSPIHSQPSIILTFLFHTLNITQAALSSCPGNFKYNIIC